MKRALVLALLLGAAGCREKSDGPIAEDPKKAVVRGAEFDEGPCEPNEVERWPDRTYAEPAGESPFHVFAHGRHVRLARVGASWIAHDFPHFFTLAGGKVRALPVAPRPAGSHAWQVEAIAGSPSHLVVEIDEPRHHGRPSPVRARYTLEAGNWKVEAIGEGSPSYRLLTLADGRIVDVREGALVWLGSGAPAALDFGPPGKGCPHAYRYLDGALVAGQTTWISGRACSEPQREFLARFGAGDDHAALALAPFDLLQPKYAVGADGTAFVAGDCAGEKGGLKEGCYATIDEAGWHPLDGPEGFAPQATAVDAQKNLWVVVGATGDFNGRAFARRGPAPLGEISRRSHGRWDRLAMPLDPLKGWDQRRFVAETVAADGDEVYVGGYFFYTTKPSPERVRTTRRFAILRLGESERPAIELDRKE